jgi:hypothetical protein
VQKLALEIVRKTGLIAYDDTIGSSWSISHALACSVVLLAASAHATDVKTFTGTFEGTGRACYGELKIDKKQFAWNTPFSKCSTRLFRASEPNSSGGEKRYVYELRGVGKKCRYRTVVLRHPDPQQPSAAWEATGYRNQSDFAANSVEHSMSCAVIRSK